MTSVASHQAAQIKLSFPDFDFAPATTALLIVDMQRFCADANYGVGEYLNGRATEAGRYYFDRLTDSVIPTTRF